MDDTYQAEYDLKYKDHHLFYKFNESHPGKTLIWSHRGGPIWGPENSMKVFQITKDNKIDGVECDIWMSKDGVPMVLHDEDLSMYSGYSSDDVTYRWTAEELQTVDIGEGEYMPTLDEWFKFY